MPKLLAIADIHLSHPLNRTEWQKLRPHPLGSGLIIAGDIGERASDLIMAFAKAKACFKHVFWVPGNHELYTTANPEMPLSSKVDSHLSDSLRGKAKYDAFVEIAREHGVLTPEDPWMVWQAGEGDDQSNGTNSTDGSADVMSNPTKAIIALCFTLYDYSFRPSNVTREKAVNWAMEKDTIATDEALLHPDPYPTRDDWCEALCSRWEAKFRDYSAKYPGVPFIIVNHWPLREDLVYIPRIPRFSLWCGTKKTEGWHRKGAFGDDYPGASVVISGHLHVRRTDRFEQCRFEEVSLGYPKQWADARDGGMEVNEMLRVILPYHEKVTEAKQPTIWRRYG